MRMEQVVRGMARVAALAGLALLPLAAAQGQTPKYSVTKIGTLTTTNEIDSVYAMSSDGSKIVGSAYHWSGNKASSDAFYWDGSLHSIGAMNGTPGAEPISVNSSGMVLLGITPASVWTLAGGKVLLPSPTGGSGISGPAAYTMNEAGMVAGMADNPDVLLGTSGGSPVYAKIGLRWANNASGQWAYAELPPLAGHNFSRSSFCANAIDQSGNVIGISAIESADSVLTDLHAVLWDSSLALHDLGALPQSDPRSGSLPIDSRTDASFQTRFVFNVGSRAFYSDPTRTTELSGSGAASPSAAAKGVNVLGQVAGVASFATGSHAFYWDTSFPSGTVTDLGVLPGMTSSSFGPWAICR